MEIKNPCSRMDDDGTILNDCEDLPITYCKKCGSFYVLDKEGNREEISLKIEEYTE